ncbi:MAG: PTS glucose/sucrose transporter subunit IIB [Hungatella hathewayi]
MANQTYHELAAEILKLIGGKENISFFTHCVTRLRFNLKDQSLADEEAIGKLNGVLGTKIQNGQFQVIIGNKVNEVYAAFCELAGLEKDGINENLDLGIARKITRNALGNHQRLLCSRYSGCRRRRCPEGNSHSGEHLRMDVRRFRSLYHDECGG